LAPGYFQAIENNEEKHNQQMQITNLNAKLTIAKSLGGLKTVAGQNYMRQLMQDPAIQKVAGQLSLGENGFTTAAPDKNTDPLERLSKILELQEKNTDAATGKPRDESVAQLLSDETSKITGIQSNIDPATGQLKKKVTLADMIAGYPQDTKRSGWGIFGDDTISPENVKAGAKNYVELQKAQGVDEQQARKQATKEYAGLTASDKGSFQKYPKMDIAQLFVNEDTRKTAIDTGKAVVDTGDGVDTTVDTYSKLGIQDPDTIEQLDTLQSVAGKDYDIKQMSKTYPDDMKMLLRAINQGVPDTKNPGKARKLTTQEILQILAQIRGN